jgi:hypothetical protein
MRPHLFTLTPGNSSAIEPSASNVTPVAVEIVGGHDSQLVPGLLLLLQASRSAEQCGRSPWEFAVEIGELQGAGLSHAHLRWLVCHGYAEHACERTSGQDANRSFEPSTNISFSASTCFVLTALGLPFIAQIVDERATVQLLPPPPDEGVQAARPVPRWDCKRRELWWGEVLVKSFRVPAENQETVLAALEEEGWPERIDDPLRQASCRDAKARLHDTIKALNRSQTNAMLRFHGDGTGQAVLWRLNAKP